MRHGVRHANELLELLRDNGGPIDDQEENRRIFADRPDLIGKPISERQVLEVPVQNKLVPQTVIDEANERGSIIRDPNGKVYKLQSPSLRPCSVSAGRTGNIDQAA